MLQALEVLQLYLYRQTLGSIHHPSLLHIGHLLQVLLNGQKIAARLDLVRILGRAFLSNLVSREVLLFECEPSFQAFQVLHFAKLPECVQALLQMQGRLHRLLLLQLTEQ